MERFYNNDYIGLMQLGYMSYKQADILDKHMKYGDLDDEEEDEEEVETRIIELYCNAKKIHSCFAEGLAIYFETNQYPFHVIERLYLEAIENDDSPFPVVNLADFYKKNNHPNMLQYFNLAIDQYDDIESMVQMALHYAKAGDTLQAVEYYQKAVSTHALYPVIGEDDSDILRVEDILTLTITDYELIKLIQCIPTTPNEIYNFLFKQIHGSHILDVYQNKIRLFTALQHVVECGVCLETKLNLDLPCGHCVCKDCYLHLLNAPCPFCRLTPKMVMGGVGRGGR